MSTSDGSGIISSMEDQLSLTAGIYRLRVTDLNGCMVDRTITLTEPEALSISLAGTNITCASPGFDNGRIDLSIAGGVIPYQVSWSNGMSSEDINNLTPGTYVVGVTDKYGCFITDSIVIALPPALTITSNVSSYNGFGISCFGMADGHIDITPTNGDAPFTFLWTGPDGFTSTSPDLNGLKAGSYIVRMTDMNLCRLTDTIVLTQPGRLGMNVALPSSNTGEFNINCAGDKTGTIEIETLNPVGAPRIIWSDGSMGNFRYNLPAGSYEVIITDKNNCIADTVITLSQPDSIRTTIEVEKPFCSDMPDGSISLSVTGGVVENDYLFSWSDNSSEKDRENITKGIYVVSVKDDNGCEVIDTVFVETENEICLVIPNIFSPNGDFINDEWNIDKIDLYPKAEITIFNRWGETVWRSEEGYPDPWDGRSNGVMLPVDSYHYLIDMHNGAKIIIGNITIVK